MSYQVDPDSGIAVAVGAACLLVWIYAEARSCARRVRERMVHRDSNREYIEDLESRLASLGACRGAYESVEDAERRLQWLTPVRVRVPHVSCTPTERRLVCFPPEPRPLVSHDEAPTEPHIRADVQ